MSRLRYLVRRCLATLALSRSGLVLRSMSQRGLVPSLVWRRLPAPDAFEVAFSTADGGRCSFQYLNSDGDLNARGLYWRGLPGFEPAVTAAATALFPSCRHVVDVGANTGIYTLTALAAAPDCRVTAFEPTARFRHALLRNLEANGWAARCDVQSAAVDASDGEAAFFVPAGDSPYSSRLASAAYRTPFEHEHSDRVEVRALDSALGAQEVDLIKIDVEGAEDRVLQGGLELLSRCKPTLFFECHPEGRSGAIDEALSGLGYSLYRLADCVPEPLTHVVPVTNRRANNFAAVLRGDHQRALAVPN